ncbi:nucleotidyl transferase AbiEii/AbiGii toxin family protein [Solwaraspora sp. WMMD406]|uniref:nucleotidyl transferase AbiEii/AbiGii toxin family protein n=1 Tax=Solwaraspora sp. WMMD406 TaxID=3016095 RepID=UPI0024161EC0|nr:nucleotidyl transferase AbiEii/AbiGii toxin family protein [Solwaraspora sp. WMMD406]MDG4766170.1 nucleotidyl transferase AbiEii/AbiGii toxin family protein [Solwaraspora sp. WMMD406]
MTPEEFQAEVARLALAVARRHGFALAGGHALIAHGVVDRPTEDVDLFTDQAGGVAAAADLVMSALSQTGLHVQTVGDADDVGGVFDGFEHDLVECEVSNEHQVVRLQLVRFDRHRQPVMMRIGPVLHLDDVLGTKVAALATRAAPRDYIDTAAALTRYSRDRLIGLARQADSGLTDEDFTDAMQRLDRMDDSVFREVYGLTAAQINEVRHRFAAWPRSAT